MKRSVFRKLFSIEMAILYAVLVTAAVLFSFPFVWMVATSFKTSREMAGADFWPTAPRPQAASPYIDLTEFDEPHTLSGVTEADWRRARPRLEQLFLGRVHAWQARAADSNGGGGSDSGNGNGWPIESGTIDPASFRHEMVQGLFTLIGDRLSDTARSAGPDAVVREAGRLVDDAMLARAFDRIYRRISLGAVRVRSSDYQMHAVAAGEDWQVVRGEGELVERRRQDGVSLELDVRFTQADPACTLGLEPQVGFESADIDRVFISCRGDGSWARVGLRVVRAGQVYRTHEVINFSDHRGREIQLRWRDDSADPMQRRVYYWLDHVGPAPEGSPPFSVQLTVTKNGLAGAWLDKVLHQYRAVFREIPFGRYIMTSLALSILSIVLMVFGSTLSAYAFARLDWPGRDLCFVIMLATMMIPPQVTMIPSFLIFKSVGWYDTLLPLWVPAVFGTPFFIFLLRQFLKTIPKDLEDAARIDGCGFLRIYWHVMIPLVTPTIAIIAVYTFIATWNNFMGPLIYVNDDRLFPLAMGLFKFNLRAGSDVGLMMAASFIMTLPIILLFFFVQRYFIQGVTLTGMKG
jgi:ABC-type glycerol-3-phosphate transport system permease component